MLTLNQLEGLLQQKKISRREFIAHSALLGLASASYPLFHPKLTQAITPKKGGRLRIGTPNGSTVDSLDPALMISMSIILINFGQLSNCLVEINHKNESVPELAESWESSQDAKKWIFKLRKGVEFHNSKTMDADDVISSLNHHRGKNSKSGAKPLLNPIDTIKKDGKYNVIFTLNEGNTDFPYILSDFHLVIFPKDVRPDSGIFTGPYVIKDFEPGVRTFATKNQNYFKSDRGHFDEIETLIMNDSNARIVALKTGQVDLVSDCDPKTVALLKKLKGIQVIEQNGNRHYTYPMRCDTFPYNNNHVRLALKYSIDRDQMVKTILRGYGLAGNDHPIGINSRYYASELKQRTYDPDKAKFHLKKAGLGNHEFRFHTADNIYSGALDAAALYKESAAKAGINIKIVRQPNDGYWDNVWLKKAWSASLWNGRPTEDMMLSTVYRAGAPWNETFWNHKRFNELLVKARTEWNEKKRSDMYFEMQRIIHDEGGAIVPMFVSDIAIASDKIAHGPLSVYRELDGLKAAERWWFKG